MQLKIFLHDDLYAGLTAAAASIAEEEPGFTASDFIRDVLVSDLASRRLHRMPERGGVTAPDIAPGSQHRLCLPERDYAPSY